MGSARARHSLVVGAGFIGTHLVETLLAADRPTRVLTRSPLPSEVSRRIDGADARIGDAAIRAVIEDALENVDELYFCAGGLMPAQSNLDPTTDAALALPPLINVLEAVRARPAVGITFLSSGGTVYGDPITLPVTEEHPTNPITSYGVMKLASEKYMLMYRQLYGIRARVLRCSNVYGEGQPAGRGQGLIAAILDRLLSGQPVTVYGDGLNERDFVYVRDVARVMVELARTDGGPAVLNVGSGRGTTLRDVIDAVERVTQRQVPVETREDRGFDVRRIVLDISALRSVVSFEPTPLEDGISAAWLALQDS